DALPTASQHRPAPVLDRMGAHEQQRFEERHRGDARQDETTQVLWDWRTVHSLRVNFPKRNLLLRKAQVYLILGGKAFSIVRVLTSVLFDLAQRCSATMWANDFWLLLVDHHVPFHPGPARPRRPRRRAAGRRRRPGRKLRRPLPRRPCA